MKKLQFLLVLMLLTQLAKAQPGIFDSSHSHSNCGLTAEKLMTMGVLMNKPNIPPGYPTTGIVPCGKFMVYYDDLAYGTAGGFDEPGGIGTTRRNTLCSVLTYIQSVFDFGKIPAGQYIRLHVDSSYTHIYHADDPRTLAWGAPFFNRPLAPGTVTNGFIYDYTKTGSDPMPGNWHGEVRINFDTSVISRDNIKVYLGGGTQYEAPEFQNGLADVQACQYDLYSVLLHMVSHAMGYYGMINVQHGGIWTPGVYTALDTSTRRGGEPLSGPGWKTDPLVQAYLSGLNGYWLDNSPVPYRTGFFFGHFTTDLMANRVASGNAPNFVMSLDITKGFMSRSYTKEELKAGRIIGYDFNPTSFSGSSSSAANYNNRRPWCSKNYDYYENKGFYDSSYNYFDTTKPDFTVTNNIGSTLVINLGSDTSLHDDDGDIMSIVPTSLVNIRGCGIGGNNHNALVLSNANRTITYTPRANFYGKAQFYFTVTDGKEEGTLRMYTIDVKRGTNVSVSFGQNLVLNGDHEMGTEVNIRDSFELSPKKGNDWRFGNYLRSGTFFSDAHPFSNQPIVRNSWGDCSSNLYAPYTFGSPGTTFPWAWDTLRSMSICAYTVRYPDAVGGIGNRYATADNPSMYNLGDSVKKCRSYMLEFDAIRAVLPHPRVKFCVECDLIDTITIGFTDGTQIVKTNPANSKKHQQFTVTTDKLTHTKWNHISIPLTYCSDTAANILYIKIGCTAYNQMGISNRVVEAKTFAATVLVDNISLKEIPLTVKATDTLVETCIHKLTALPNVLKACATDYVFTWTTLSGTVVGTGPVIGVSPATSTKYILTMDNGCRVVRDTITVQGVYCPCGPQDVFGDTVGFTIIRGSMSTIPASPYYFVTASTTITNDATIKAANVLIAPNVEIRIADSVKLTLDSAHLFTCPTDNKMWEGLRLNSGTTRSGRIVVKNNSCIEDAKFAIDGLDLKQPLNGNIIDVTNSTFNRNQVDISVNRSYIPAVSGKYPINIVGNVFTARLFTRANSPGYPFRWPSVSTLKSWVSPAIDGKPSYAVNRNYLKALCKDTAIFSYLGVRINNIGTTFGAGSSFNEVVIGGGASADDFNMFDNHANGVVIYSSNVSLYNNTFTNISRRMVPSTSTTLPVENGMGVAASGDASRYQRLQLMPFGMNFQNRFFDCYSPVYAESYAELTMSNMVITSSHKLGIPVPGAAYPSEVYTGIGINVRGDGAQYRWSITNNEISNMNTGIYTWLLYSKPGASTVIDKNKIYAANPDPKYSTLTADQYMLQGIEVYSPASGGTAKSLSVSENVLNNVFKGIYINGMKDHRTTVYKNTVNLWDVTRSVYYTQDGISLTDCYDSRVTENLVSTPVFGRENEENRLRGYFAANNTNLKVCSNTANRTGRGFEFGQWTTQTGVRWISNVMNTNWKGFVLGSEIGDQGAMKTSWGTHYYGATGNIWRSFGGTQSQTFGDKDRRTWLAKLYVRNITTGAVERPTLNFTSHLSRSFPYLYAIAGPTVSPASLVFTNNVANCEGIEDGGVTKSDPLATGLTKTLAGIVVADSMQYDPSYQVSQWMNQLSIYEMGMLEPDLVSTSQVFGQFMVAANTSRFSWVWNTQKALTEGNIQNAELLLNQPLQAFGRLQVSPDVVVTDIPEADYVVDNYKSYFSLFLKFLKGTITPEDSDLLYNLSQKCPATDGAVVYKARGLFHMVSNETVNYNDDSCMYNGGNFLRKMSNNQMGDLKGYSLYPNPNQGSFVIKQLSPMNNRVKVRVYNSLGILIYQSYLNFTNGTISVELGNQPSGVYLACISEDEMTGTCLRFTIK